MSVIVELYYPDGLLYEYFFVFFELTNFYFGAPRQFSHTTLACLGSMEVRPNVTGLVLFNQPRITA